MTAAELASFRALLQAQAGPPSRPDEGLFARMRARLRLVERAEPPAAPFAAAPEPPRKAAGEARPRTEPTCDAGAAEPPGGGLTLVVADPPPTIPPAFGRRAFEPAPETPPPPAAAPVSAVAAGPELGAVRLRRRVLPEEVHVTPEEDLRPPRPEAPVGVIAGWSAARPPSAQRRVLQRLEAVLSAERQGLDARRGAVAER